MYYSGIWKNVEWKVFVFSISICSRYGVVLLFVLIECRFVKILICLCIWLDDVLVSIGVMDISGIFIWYLR